MNAQVFEIASKLEETPLVSSPVHKAPTDPLPLTPDHQHEDSLEVTKPYSDDDIDEVCLLTQSCWFVYMLCLLYVV